MRSRPQSAILRSLLAILCALALIPGDTLADTLPVGQETASSAKNQAAKIPPEQLDSLVAPIALYPDPMLAQVLAASTYPLEIIQLQQWLENNKSLKDKALADAVGKQSWDPSVQALAALPEVVKRLANDIQWTTDLGNAFLAQQSDVMDAVQRMRKKAQDKGNLKTTEQQKVETKVIENKSVIVVEQASPQVVYVPSYDPVVVYGAPVYPYPPIYYPPAWYYPAGMAISFGVGVMMGAFWSGGWGCGWGHNDININSNRYNTINNNNIRSGRANQLQTNQNNWRHDSGHRGGVAYRDNATRQNYQRQTGGSAQARQNFRGYDGGQRTGGQGSSTAGAGAARGQRQAGASSTQTPGGAAGAARTGQGQRASPTQTPGGAAGAARTGQAQRFSPQAFQGVGNGAQVQAQANRGQFSRQSAAASAPRYSGGGGARMGGGGRGGGGRR